MAGVCEHCGLETDKFLYECNWCGMAVCEACRLPEHHDCDSGPVGGDTPEKGAPEPMESGSIMRDYTRRKDQPGYGPSGSVQPPPDSDEGHMLSTKQRTVLILVIVLVLVAAISLLLI